MPGLIFQDAVPVLASAPNRSDIACFVGFVLRRAERPLPDGVAAWLAGQGWTAAPFGRDAAAVEALLDIPVAIDSWDLFDALYAWERRGLVGDTRQLPTYLGSAVRSFFAQGGRKCYVVRVGDPWLVGTGRPTRLRSLERLIPGHPYSLTSSPGDRASWSGIGHIFGLPDVSFLCLPDLADACASDIEPFDTASIAVPTAPEIFVECSGPSPATAPDHWSARLQAPRLGDAHYTQWAQAVAQIGEVLATHACEVQFVAALPLPTSDAGGTRDPLAFLLGDGDGPLALDSGLTGIASKFIQLVYPWVRTAGSADLPEQLESPDGVLTGALARNALALGTFHGAQRQGLGDVYDIEPVLTRAQMMQSADQALIERVSIIGNLPSGLNLLSDVTTSLDPVYRPAAVARLVASIARAARRLGEDLVFEALGEELWATLRAGMEGLLQGLYDDAALRGATPDEAFQVRCDETTMSQNDIDNGRVIAEIVFDPAAPIDTIRVVLTLTDRGELSLVPAQAPVVQAVAA
jgi:uncharacterized protein